MSHFTTVKTQVKDLAAMKAAAESMGLSTAEHANCRGYFSSEKNICDMVIKLPGPYDVGLKKSADGTYDVVADYWNGHVANVVGNNCSKLLQEYSYQVIARQARMKGYQLRRVNRGDGTIKVTVMGVR